MSLALETRSVRNTGAVLAVVALAWGAAVAVAAATGLLGRLPGPALAPIIMFGVLVPVGVYLWIAPVRRWVEAVGLYPLTVFHVWRIPAALMFLWYGAQDLLPPAFWILAGVDDLIAGISAARLVGRPLDRARLLRFHRLGFADFLVAVGTGLTFTLLNDPRMSTLRELPMALIPLFGVGISGATHLIAFHLLWKHRKV